MVISTELLLANAELVDERPITVLIDRPQVVEQPAPLADELEQPSPAVMVLLVGLEVLGEVSDSLGEERHLHLG